MLSYHQPRWMHAYNSGSYEVPTHGLVEIAGGDYDTTTADGPTLMLQVKRPTAVSLQQFAVNSWKTIPVGETGLVTFDAPVIVEYASALSVGDTFGTGLNVFTADTDETGMVVLASLGSDKYLCDFVKSADATPLKQFCTFTLDNALTTSESSESATISTQFGHGTDHSSTAITVNNLPDGTSTYVFEGDSGDYGMALYSGSGTTWYIIQMECP